MSEWAKLPKILATAATLVLCGKSLASAMCLSDDIEWCWKRSSFVVESRIASSLGLEPPKLGSSRQIYLQLKPQSHLLPGVNYRPPDMPEGFELPRFTHELEERQRGWGFPFNDVFTTVVITPGIGEDPKLRFQPGDPRRRQAEDGFNFFSGMSGGMLGYSGEVVSTFLGAGQITAYAVAALISAKRTITKDKSWESLHAAAQIIRRGWMPYGGLSSPFKGDDPMGGTLTQLGYEYVASGQYIWDQLSIKGTPQSRLFDAVRWDAREEAISRLGKLPHTVGDEIDTRIKRTRTEMRAIVEAARSEETAREAYLKLLATQAAEDAARKRARDEDDRLKNELEKESRLARERQSTLDLQRKREEEREAAERLAKAARAAQEKREQDERDRERRRREDDQRRRDEERNRSNQQSFDASHYTPVAPNSGGSGGVTTSPSGDDGGTANSTLP